MESTRRAGAATPGIGGRPRVSVLTACFNEEENVAALIERVRGVFAALGEHSYEHVFIDNASTDGTVRILKEIAASDPKVKIIVNTRNFGHIRSPFHGIMQCHGDAVISLVADLQDPPELMADFLAKWRQGYKVVLGVKTASQENGAMFAIRKLYYSTLNQLSEVELVQNSTGFGLYDQEVVEMFRTLDDPYPYFRGIISELGYDYATIEYEQPMRTHGKTKNNFYTLYDMGMQGIVSHSKIPLRLASILGFTSAAVSLVAAFVYLVFKLAFWNTMSFGLAPLLIGMFFVSSVQLFFLGIIGEYVGSVHTQVHHRPLVVERERVNFDAPPLPADRDGGHEPLRMVETAPK